MIVPEILHKRPCHRTMIDMGGQHRPVLTQRGPIPWRSSVFQAYRGRAGLFLKDRLMDKLLQKQASLDDAHDRLTKELTRAIAEWDRNGSYDVGDLLNRIEEFVFSLGPFRGGMDELERRAGMVESVTVEGSPYAISLDAVLRGLAPSGPHPKLFGKRMGVLYSRLRQSRTPASSVSELVDLRTLVDQLVNEAGDGNGEVSERAGGAIKALEQCRVACTDVVRQARDSRTDGCRTLLNVYLAMGAEPPDSATTIVATLRGGTIGGALLEDARSAADSLVCWVHAREDEVQTQVVGAADPEQETIGKNEKRAGKSKGTASGPRYDKDQKQLERDKWICEQRKANVTIPKIIESLKKIALDREWEPLYTDQSITDSVNRYCGYVGDAAPKSKAGRPRKQSS